MRLIFVSLLMLAVLFTPMAMGQEAVLPPQEEARAQALMRELRCVACENEPISQSSAPIAEDMRIRVRAMIAEGASDAEVRDWFEGQYGEFVRFRPKASGVTGWLLWTLPFLLLMIGGALAFLISRRKETEAAEIEAEDVT